MEERPQIELVTVFHRDTCHREVHQRTFVTSGYRVKRVLPWAMSKWTKHIVTFNEEEDEDTLVEEGPQIERGHRVSQGTHATVRLTQEALVTSRSRVMRVLTWRCQSGDEEEDEVTLVEEGSQIERGTVSPRDTRHCETHPKSIRDKRMKVGRNT